MARNRLSAKSDFASLVPAAIVGINLAARLTADAAAFYEERAADRDDGDLARDQHRQVAAAMRKLEQDIKAMAEEIK
jgi:hypothetical protein